MRKELEEYFREILKSDATEDKEGALSWRMSCYDSGQDIVNYVENNHFPLKHKTVLDSACAWGSHILSFGAAGAEVFCADLNDHCYDKLQDFAKQQKISLKIKQANCETLPFDDCSFDLILGLELIEHIESPQKYAFEVSRLLRKGGICIVTTPSRWKSVYWGEPHYNIKGLTLLPFVTQRFVATHIFRKKYPFPITRQYNTASAVMQPFLNAGLSGTSKINGIIAKKTKNIPLLNNIAKELLWDFIVFEKK
ncbi:MAG: class I SAM-dependent methyltransferase [Gammaproteobacteria bacterium]|nr:class I SAM-dependent methyltransferase [Gammaproteobacteria bacterium]